MTSLRDSKDAFFDSIEHLRNEVIPKLKDSNIVEEPDVVRLDLLLADIRNYGNKSARLNEVYWNAVGPVFSASIEKMNEIISKLSTTRLPINILIVDFLKSHWRWAVMFVIGIITLIIMCG
jgi:hypothetical protein